MSKAMSLSVKFVAVVVLLLLSGLHTAKADSFTPSSSTSTTSVFSNVLVYYVTANAASNPWGLTNILANPVSGVLGNSGGQATSTETVALIENANGNFFDIQVGSSKSGSIFFTQFFGNSTNKGIPFTGTTANPNINPNTWTFNSSTDTSCYLNTVSSPVCNGPASSPLGISVLQTPGGVDVFSLQDSSIEVAFALTPGTVSTPEPSSLLMLGSGLIGLMGLGLRGKGIV
jgi:hypothetical protein